MCKKLFVSGSLIISLLLVGLKQLIAQVSPTIEVKPEPFNNKHGLSQGFVSAIIQDSDGYMWFATKDGLNRFDGYNVTVYRNSQQPFSIPDNSIAQVLEDGNKNLWVGTRNKGLFLFDREQERFYPVELNNKDRQINNPIQFLQWQNGKLLVEDYFDICIYDVSKIIPGDYHHSVRLPLLFCYKSLPGITTQRLHSGVNWLKDYSIWKASADSVFVCRPDAQWKQWRYERYSMTALGMSSQRMFASFDGDGNTVVLVGSNGLAIIDTITRKVAFNKSFRASTHPPMDYFANTPYRVGKYKLMYYDVDGYHQFDLQHKTDLVLHTDEKIAKTGLGGLSHCVDRDGVLWIGSIGYGVFKYNQRTALFNIFAQDCKGFVEDSDQSLFINLRSGALKFSPATKELQPLMPVALRNRNWINAIVHCRSKSGSTWIQVTDQLSQQPHLLQYLQEKQTVLDRSKLLQAVPGAQLLYMFTDASNRLWQLVYDTDRSRKLVVADEQTGEVIAIYTIPQAKDVNSVSSFLNSFEQDVHGNFWFCTNRGFLFFDPVKAQWKEYKNNPADQQSLSSDIIFSTCPDPVDKNRIRWVGTNGGGLNRLDLTTGKCKRYTQQNGLPNDVIYGIMPDEGGNLWLSTNQGLSCFNIRSEQFHNYTQEDGLAGNEFNRGQFLKSANGYMYFGGVDGITWFKPQQILDATLSASPIAITGLLLYNKPVQHGADSTILKKPISYSDSIILPYEQNMFTIEFSLLQFCSAERKHYQYRLLGFDKTWIDIGSKNAATYTNLDPGTYVFQVKGRNSDGVWNEQGKSITIIIIPPWYRTWWFRILLAVFIFGSLYAFYRYRLHQSLKVIKMRNSIASDLHDEIGSTISSITVYSDIIKEKSTDENLRQIAGRISESSSNILVVMSDIVWSINPLNDRFDNVLIRMKAFAHEVLDVQDKQLVFEADDQLNHIKLHMNNRKNFYLIFKEALNNAVKYAQASSIVIKVRLHGNEVLFSIEDNGAGFDVNTHKEGNGIANMQRRSKDLGGTISIQSALGKGTCIQLRFPV